MIGNKTKDSVVISLNSVWGSPIDGNDVALKFNEYLSQIGEKMSGNFNDCEASQRYLGDDHCGISFNLRSVT